MHGDPKGSLQAWIDTVWGGGNPKRGRRGQLQAHPLRVALDRPGPFPTLKCVQECGSGRLGQC